LVVHLLTSLRMISTASSVRPDATTSRGIESVGAPLFNFFFWFCCNIMCVFPPPSPSELTAARLPVQGKVSVTTCYKKHFVWLWWMNLLSLCLANEVNKSAFPMLKYSWDDLPQLKSQERELCVAYGTKNVIVRTKYDVHGIYHNKISVNRSHWRLNWTFWMQVWRPNQKLSDLGLQCRIKNLLQTLFTL
jgi:hypothetical protein